MEEVAAVEIISGLTEIDPKILSCVYPHVGHLLSSPRREKQVGQYPVLDIRTKPFEYPSNDLFNLFNYISTVRAEEYATFPTTALGSEVDEKNFFDALKNMGFEGIEVPLGYPFLGSE